MKIIREHFTVQAAGQSMDQPARGMTLVELMVSLVILMIVLGAVYSILNLQQTKAVQVSRTTVLQTDAQVAFTLLKWDLLLAGIGYPYQRQNAIQLANAGGDVTLRATGLGFEMNRMQWSYLIDDAAGSEIRVRRWDDTWANFQAGDTIMITNEVRDPVHVGLIITSVDTFTYFDPIWNQPIKGLRLQIPGSIAARAGLLVFKRTGDIYDNGLTYTLAGDTLLRGNEPLLTNIEAIQFRYGIDTDNDNVVETWSDANNPPFNPGYSSKWAVRFTMVVSSGGMTDYHYLADTVTIENDPPYKYGLSPREKQRKRAILSTTVYPQNLQPPEGS